MPTRPPARRHEQASGRRTASIAALAILSLTFVTRLLNQPTLGGDDFVTLWMVPAILKGDLPFRDFVEPATPLKAALSALGQLIFGYRLLGETLPGILFIAAGTAISFYLARRAACSTAIALLVTAMILPLHVNPDVVELYSYPKVFLYPLILWVCWRYFDTSSPARAAVLGLVTGVAFLFRHDHGLHAGVAAGLTLLLTHWRGPRQVFVHRLALTAVAAGLLVGPFLLVVQVNERVVAYFLSRYDLGARIGLGTAPSLSALLDRCGSCFWLYLVELCLPWAVLLVLAWEYRRDRWTGSVPTPEALAMVTSAVLVIVAMAGLVREQNVIPHLANVAGMAAVLGAWLIGRTLPWVTLEAARGDRPSGWPFAAMRGLVVLGLCLVTLWAARNFGGAERLIANTGVLGGPAGVAERFGRVMAVQARTPPIDASEDGGWFTARELAFSRYVRACTRDDDGIIVLRSGGPVGLLFPYIAERRLAAGHPYWANGWRSSPEHQRESLTLWQRQSVPVVWLQDDAGDAIFRRYDLLYDHLARHYVAHTVAAGPNRAGFGGVWLDASGLATGVYEPLGLPCFR